MKRDRWLNGSELLIYLKEQGFEYNPYAETFNSMLKRSGVQSFISGSKRRFLKENVDLAIKKLHKKRPLTSHREQSRVVVNHNSSTTQF